MRLSLCLDPSRPWAEARALAEAADEAGWYAVYQCDHFMPYAADGAAVDGPVSECWTTLAALASATRRVRIGSLVLGASFRHPAVVAAMAATLDRVSDGRLVLGVGAGWQTNEHAAYGIPLLPVPERLDAFEEHCAVLRAFLDGGRVTFEGSHYRLHDAPCDPPPVQERLPLLVGGAGEVRTMRVAARFADVWHAWVDPPELVRKNAVLDARCYEVDRDPAGIARATGAGVRVGVARGDRDIEGLVDHVVDRLVAYREAGADEFVVRDHGSDDVAEVVDQVRAMASEVLPLLRA